MKRYFTHIFLLLVVSIVFIGCSTSDQGKDNGNDSNSSDVIELITYTHFPDDNELVAKGLKKFSEEIYERTDGRVELIIHTGGDLNYQNDEVLSAVSDNLVNVANVPMNEVTGDEPSFRITTIPGLIPSFEEMEVFHEISDPYFKEILEEDWNQKYLYSIQWPFAGFWTKEIINSVDDIEGLKMRTYDESTAKLVKGIGGTPHSMGFGEVYSSLSTGLINSVLTSSQTAVDGKFWEVLDYFAPVNVAAPKHFVTINLDEFNKIDPELQDIIMEVAEEMEDYSKENLEKVIEDTESTVMDEGVEIVEPSEELLESIKKASEQIIEEHVSNGTDVEKKIYEEYIEKIN